jgi:hypothetical protein
LSLEARTVNNNSPPRSPRREKKTLREKTENIRRRPVADNA